ncbi:TonB-dependent receptor [Hymenobacter psychrophilus]|uniref:Carboxypeptidase regulatory-like domain-containing protein n=1 Tax=Hymenobacter psychrophilus TaxID=651662 RepID=A0A1H3MVP7_9BACT|nr:carboxypeptidase regulatory-like domain-containing protein [Hymenobacter psychrophilus]SDY80761.1 Carboxypeptidase regulatory-like domain-containing protein [Hymenobacter psychrophilus]
MKNPLLSPLRRPWLLTGLLWVLLTVLTHPLRAQSTDASIAGVVQDARGEAVPGATVVVKNGSTGFQTGVATSADGRYALRQLPLGGPYEINVSFVGFAPQRRTGYTLNQGDRITVDFRLSESAEQLQEVVVTENALTSRIDRLGSSTAIGAQAIQRLPALNRDFTSLADLAPTSNGRNIGGQLASSTNYLIDGLSSRNMLTSGPIGRGPYTLSLEAIREFEVAYNVYDVTQGRQGGGVISAATKSGTNTFTGSAFTYHRADWLANPRDIRGNKRTVDFSTTQYGFSLGGPVIKDKLHFFVALDRQQQALPFFIADIQRPDDEQALSISRAVLDSVISIGREKYGLSSERQTGSFDRKTLATTVFARIDWQLNDKHRLTLRNNYSDWDNPTSTDDNSRINLYETWAGFSSRENSTALSLRSTFSSKLLNELKMQYVYSYNAIEPNPQLPANNIPRAIVTVRSVLPDGRTGQTDVQFGGQRFTPETQQVNQLQLVNTSYLTAGRFNFTFGTDNMLTFLDNYVSNEQNGRFIFNSLREFNDLNPSRYAREVPLNGIPDVQHSVLDASVFAQALYNPHPDVTAQLGVRYDVTSYLTPAAYNPLVEQELGLRTDAQITDWDNIQPRLQLTWDVGGKSRDIFRLGGGVFSAYVINYAQLNNIQNDGTQIAAIDVTRPNNPNAVNPVPRPNFPGYRQDPSTVPGVPAGTTPVATINLTDPNFEVPTVYKANLSYNRIVNEWLRVGVNALVSRTDNNYVYLDGNLRDEPNFRLANEENRGVFVPANTISSRGQTNNVLSRRSKLVGRTLVLTNGAKLRTATLIVDAQVELPRIGSFNASYTLNDARDNTSYNGNVANTSTFRPVKSDPRDLSEMNYSDNHFRHKVVLYGVSPVWKGFSLNARFSGISGTRYSLLVAGDINGDFVGQTGVRNDLAFVPDPNDPSTSENIRTALNQLLNESDSRAKDYIRESFGTIADRNGGVNKQLTGVVDVRLLKSIKTFKTQSLELSIDVFNFANLLNKDWGGNFNLGNQNLLNVAGFSQATQQYIYTINSGAGVVQKNGTPYQIQLGVRYAF